MSDNERMENYTIHGVSVWAYPSEIKRGNAALAPDHHVVDGRLNIFTCFDGDSFGHLVGTTVKRYGAVIGTVDDLIPVNRIAVVNPENVA